MSIYDNSFSDEPKKTPEKSSSAAVPEKPAAPPPKKPSKETTSKDSEESDRVRRKGCGCGSCLLVCLAFGVVFAVVSGITAVIVVKRAPDWFHDAIIAAVNDSNLDDKTKQEIAVQMDRLLKEYKAGNVSNEQLFRSMEELGKSPVLVLVIAYTAMEVYIEPSGLSDDEKANAKLAFQRVARGAFDESIDPDDLDDALNFISKEDFNGNRQFKGDVSDEDLRALVKECTRVADEAGVPKEPYQVDVAAEVKRIVDRALGIMPEEEPETDLVHSSDMDLPAEETAANSDEPDATLDEAAASSSDTAATTAAATFED